MPYSSNQGKMLFKEWLFEFMYIEKVIRILDVGAGAGIYGTMCLEVINEVKSHKGDLGFCLDAVEIFTPYIEQFSLNKIYDHIFPVDICAGIDGIGDYDLIILGDVLEHFEIADVKKTFVELKRKTKFVWLSIPCQVEGKDWSFGYHQLPAEWEYNPAERHTHEWTFNELNQTIGPFLWTMPYPVVAVLVAEGDRK